MVVLLRVDRVMRVERLVPDEAPVAEEQAAEAPPPLDVAETPVDEAPREELPPPAEEVHGTSIAEPAPDSARVRGLLTDAATGEPLPHYLLRVRDARGKQEDVFTDDVGRYTTASAMPSGTVRIRPLDGAVHPRSLPEIAREHAVRENTAPDIDLAVASGPTFRFALTPPDAAPPTEFRADLQLAGPDSNGKLGDEPLRVPWIGDAPWVRFAPIDEPYERAKSVDLRSRDGLWMGSGKVAAIRGVVPELVEIRLAARAVLEGHVVDDAGDPVAEATVTLRLNPSDPAPQRWGFTDAKGHYRFDFLREGSGVLVVRSLRHALEEANVRFPASHIATQDFILARLPSPGDVRARLESETGRYDSVVELELWAVDGPTSTGGMNPRTRLKVQWEETDGRKVGVVRFTGLPAGKFQMNLTDPSWFHWDPQTAVVSPPSETRFLVRDDLALAQFAFRVHDSDNGAALSGAAARMDVANGASFTRKIEGETVVLDRFPLERGFRWRIDMIGYVHAAGDEKAFSLLETRDGSSWRIADVALSPGWEDTYHVVGNARGKAIAGAVVRLDGRDAGTTDKNGTATVRSTHRPRSVEIVYRDWQPTAPIDLRSAAARGNPWGLLVRMAPPAPK